MWSLCEVAILSVSSPAWRLKVSAAHSRSTRSRWPHRGESTLAGGYKRRGAIYRDIDQVLGDVGIDTGVE